MINFIKYIATQYINVTKSLYQYWDTYGGIKALISSPYFHFSILTSFFITKKNPKWEWYAIIIEVIPSLLGFTLAGYAILMAFGNEEFMKAICGKEKDGSPSPFMEINSTFAHFIIIQIVSLLISIISNSFELTNTYIAFIGTTFFLYSITLSLAATLAILKISQWFDFSNGD